MLVAEGAAKIRRHKILGADLNHLFELQYSFIHLMQDSHRYGQFINALHRKLLRATKNNGLACLH